MSRILKTGHTQITCTFANHKGWSKGVDVVKKTASLDYIIAHSDGVVIKVVDYLDHTNHILDKEGKGYGNYVLIKHDSKYATLYAHMEKVQVKEGQTVKKGDTLGYMGNTGNSSGSHCHFETRVYSADYNAGDCNKTNLFQWIDPTEYLDSDLPLTPIPAPTPEPEVVTTYYIQAGAYTSKANAKKQMTALKKEGFNSICKYDGKTYRIQAGSYFVKDYANRLLLRLTESGYKAFITTDLAGTEVAL